MAPFRKKLQTGPGFEVLNTQQKKTFLFQEEVEKTVAYLTNGWRSMLRKMIRIDAGKKKFLPCPKRK